MINKFLKNIKDIIIGQNLEFKLRNSYGNTFDENKSKLYNQSKLVNFRNLYPSEINEYALAIAFALHPIKTLSCAYLAAEDRKTSDFLRN